MNKSEREESRRICEGATEGPWYFEIPRFVFSEKDGIIASAENGPQNDENDAVFIAHARTALPRALDTLDAAEERERELVAEGRLLLSEIRRSIPILRHGGADELDCLANYWDGDIDLTPSNIAAEAARVKALEAECEALRKLEAECRAWIGDDVHRADPGRDYPSPYWSVAAILAGLPVDAKGGE